MTAGKGHNFFNDQYVSLPGVIVRLTYSVEFHEMGGMRMRFRLMSDAIAPDLLVPTAVSSYLITKYSLHSDYSFVEVVEP